MVFLNLDLIYTLNLYLPLLCPITGIIIINSNICLISSEDLDEDKPNILITSFLPKTLILIWLYKVMILSFVLLVKLIFFN
jgi:hypothetical protein